MSDSNISPSQGNNLNPNLLLAERRVQRYPNQFFDLSQQYMPPTIKELFKWCTFYFYNSPLIGSASKKVSRYPITDLIIEDERESVRNLWDHILNKCLKVKSRMIEVNLNLTVYGNSFVSVHLPVTRMAKCKKCGTTSDIRQWTWRFSHYKFMGNCQTCGSDDELIIKDVPYKDAKKIKLIQWNPENVEIKHNEYTGKSTYLYVVPRKLRTAIAMGDKDIIEDLPLIVIQAVKDQKKIKMNPDNFFHLKMPTLAEQDQGWGKPLIIHVLKDMFYFYTLRRAQEAIAMEHIVPFDILYPMPNAQTDPYIHSDLGSWRKQIEGVIERHRRDPNFKAVIPIPVGFGRVGGDGKALLLSPEMQYLTQTIVGGMGIPQEFLFGGLSWCLLSTSYIFSSKGLIRLGECCPDHVGMEDASMDVDTRDGHKPVALVHHTDKRQVCSIRTRFGLELKGSPIHRVLCLSEDLSMDWKCLKDIKPGDFVAKKRTPDIWGSEQVPLELCRVLGHICSDGSVLDNYVTYRSTDLEDLDSYTKDFVNYFETAPHLTWTKQEGKIPCGVLSSYSKEIFSIMCDWGMYGYQKDKQVPYIIRTAKKDCVAEFLKALFSGDGCLENVTEKQCIRYTSVSKELLTQVQLLLQNFGIVSRLYSEYENQVSNLEITSEYVTLFMKEIGFTLSRKNANYNEDITRHKYRCESQKIPFLVDRLRDLKKLTNGAGAWVKDDSERVFEKDVYSVKEAAEVLKRDVSSVLIYIRNGKLKAEKEVRTDGRYSAYFISKEALREFLSGKGLSKRAAIGKTTFNINDNNFEDVNWEGVKTLDPQLYERVEAIKKEDHIWEEVVEASQSNEEVEMCDLTVYDTHSYVANGIVSHNTGSSVSLRTLENDFIQTRTQLLDLVYWIKDKIRVWLSCPDIGTLRFADFRMADDIQKNQQLIGLNAQGKLSDQTMLTELGYDFEGEVKKRLEEVHIQNYINDLLTKGTSRSQGEAQLIQFNYQNKINELSTQAQAEAMHKMDTAFAHDASGQLQAMATKLLQMDPVHAESTIAELKMQTPEIAVAVETAYNTLRKGMEEQQMQAQVQQQEQLALQQQQDQGMVDQLAMQEASNMLAPPPPEPPQEKVRQKAQESAVKNMNVKIDMRPLPEQKPPRRKGGV